MLQDDRSSACLSRRPNHFRLDAGRPRPPMELKFPRYITKPIFPPTTHTPPVAAHQPPQPCRLPGHRERQSMTLPKWEV
jgi:hypothetical protein